LKGQKAKDRTEDSAQVSGVSPAAGQKNGQSNRK